MSGTSDPVQPHECEGPMCPRCARRGRCGKLRRFPDRWGCYQFEHEAAEPEPVTQVCEACGRELPLDEAHFNRSRKSKSGFMRVCRDCARDILEGKD